MVKRTGTGQATRTTLLVVNGVGALLAAGFAGAGVARPVNRRAEVHCKTQHARRVLIGQLRHPDVAITGPFLITLLTGRPSTQLVTAAGIVQLGDAVLGFRQRNTAMTIAPAAMGVVHLITARVLRR